MKLDIRHKGAPVPNDLFHSDVPIHIWAENRLLSTAAMSFHVAMSAEIMSFHP
jgi:hypothetical protein